MATAALICLIPAAASAQIAGFSQDFEALNAASLTALGDDGWLVYGNVFAAGTGAFLYGYGADPAPNNPGAPAFSNIVVGEGGAEQGAQQVSIFSDYENAGAHVAGDLVEANFYKEFTVGAGDIGKTWTFEFQAKMGDLVAPSTATAFIKTLDPLDEYTVTNNVTQDMTATPVDWTGGTLSLFIDAGLVGQLFQAGFANTATNYEASAIIYDNLVLTDSAVPPTGLEAYSQDFESLNAGSLTALGDDGWLVFANVFAAGTGDLLYNYGPDPAPNNPAAPAFSNIAVGEGGAEQGAQQLSVFSDYENTAAQVAGDLVEANVYREQTIGVADIGKTWIFAFQAKLGGLVAPSTATAFIKTLDAVTFDTTTLITRDMTAISTDWGGYSLIINIDASLVGQLFQIGFASTATSYAGSSIIYDNIILTDGPVSAVPDGTVLLGAKLRQNYPNPFNPMTRIDFSLEKPGKVDIAVYDVAGRLVTNLLSEDMAAGDHFVTWNGLTRSGSPAASGQYRYVMKTAAGQVSRSMILLK
jgi:hypothetical protein